MTIIYLKSAKTGGTSIVNLVKKIIQELQYTFSQIKSNH